MLSHTEAQELHQLLGGSVETGIPLSLENLERALELAAVLVSDTMPSPVSYDPCIQGTIEIGGRRSEFMLLLDRPDVSYSQWSADNIVLGSRVELLRTLADAAQEWADENLCRTCKEKLIDDGEGYDGECGNCADKTKKEDDDGND